MSSNMYSYYCYSHLPLETTKKRDEFAKDFFVNQYLNSYNDMRYVFKLPKLTLDEYKEAINYKHYDMTEMNYSKILKQLRPIDEQHMIIYNQYQEDKRNNTNLERYNVIIPEPFEDKVKN
jgi:hypothetical protein